MYQIKFSMNQITFLVRKFDTSERLFLIIGLRKTNNDRLKK